MSSKHLAICATESSVGFQLFSGDSLISKSSLVYAENNIESRKNQLEDHLKSQDLLRKDYSDVSLSWSSNKSTLVPGNIFSESSPEAILKLCFGGDIPHDDIDYNRYASLGVVNVYLIPDWLKRFFIFKFPRIIIQHEGTHVIRKIMHGDTFRLKATVVLQEDTFLLLLTKHSNLEFYSFFNYQSAEDVIYHLTFALQQKELTNEKGTIDLDAGANVDQKLVQDIISGLSRIKELQELKVNPTEELVFKSQLLCV